MPQLASYNSSSTENKALLEALNIGTLHSRFSCFITMSGSALLGDGTATPYATIAMLRADKAEDGMSPVQIELNQFANRFNTGGDYRQLVLMDTGDAQEMQDVLSDEHAHTLLKDPIVETLYGRESIRFLVKNALRLKANLLAGALDPDFRAFLRKHAPYANRFSPTHFERKRRRWWLRMMNKIAVKPHYNHYRINYRAGHHLAKSADRLSEHFWELHEQVRTSGSSGRFAEARGEYATSKVLQTLFDNGQWELKKGKTPHAGSNGIDQIWVKRDKRGSIKVYLIVEAKGSKDAHLGSTTQGMQMSPRWVVYGLMQMAMGEKHYSDPAVPNQRRTATKILDAIFDDSQSIQVAGLKVHALYGSAEVLSNVVEVTDLGIYNNPKVLTNLRATPPPAKPVQTGISVYY